jgi:hypothetical protein
VEHEGDAPVDPVREDPVDLGLEDRRVSLGVELSVRKDGDREAALSGAAVRCHRSSVREVARVVAARAKDEQHESAEARNQRGG